MSTKTKTPEYVAQAVEQLRRIYEDRNPPTTFQERKKLTGWLHTSAERDAGIKWPTHFEKAELLLKLHEAGVYILPITEHVNALYEAAKDRPQEVTPTPAVKPPKFQPTEKQKETAEAVRHIYKPRSAADRVSQSIRNRATRALKHLRRIASEDAPERTLPEHTEADSLYLEACRARAEGVKTPTLRGALDSVEAVAYEAQKCWTKIAESAAPKELSIRRSGGKLSIIARTPAASPKRERRRELNITVAYDICRIAGFVLGDIVKAVAARDLRVWDIAAVKREGADRLFVGRVAAISPETITVRGDATEYTYERDKLAFEGRVKPEPIGRDDGLTDEQRDQLDGLRRKLERLGDEDDQIIRCSARYELEKKIYDIEHPVAPPYDADEWPDELRVCGE